ncbi:MAG: hypothetical protein Tsb0032_34710 [Kiloniellaceae bacterium]
MSRPLRVLMTATLASGLLFGVAACGKKGSPKPPEGQESEYTYPQAYPAPATVVPDAEGQLEGGNDPTSIFVDRDRRTTTKTY